MFTYSLIINVPVPLTDKKLDFWRRRSAFWRRRSAFWRRRVARLKMPASQNIICIWQSDAPDSMKLSKQNIFSIIFFLIFLTNSKNVYSFINNKSTCPFDRQKNWTEPFFLS